MNPKCARCEKTVYPMEKLNCLDKYWHKGCFNCEECRMTLNMKNYKGFNKKPYCNAHYPQSKPTVVSETPEIARVMQQSQQQSLTKYHEDYEKSKIKGYTPVVDTPENIRLRQQSKIQSQVKYHEDFEKQKGKAYHTVIDDPELTRVKKNTVIQSNLAYQGVKEKLQTMESRRQMIPGEHPMPQPAGQQLGTLMDPTHRMESMSIQDGHERMMQQQLQQQQEEEARHLASMRRQENPPISIQITTATWKPAKPIRTIEDFVVEESTDEMDMEYERRQGEGLSYEYDPEKYSHHYWSKTTGELGGVVTTSGMKYRKIEDFLNLNADLIYTTENESSTRESASESSGMWDYDPDKYWKARGYRISAEQRYQQVRLKPGKIEDYDPMTHPDAQQPKFEAPAAVSEPEPTIQSGQNVMRAVFDYTAAEDDEISFMDGDVIVNCVKIDDGWMTGTVQRTGQSGMLPANYVEPMS